MLCAKKKRSKVGAAADAEGLSLTSVRIILTLCRQAGNVLVGGTGGRGCSRTLKNQPGGGENHRRERESRFLSLHPGTESLPPLRVCEYRWQQPTAPRLGLLSPLRHPVRVFSSFPPPDEISHLRRKKNPLASSARTNKRRKEERGRRMDDKVEGRGKKGLSAHWKALLLLLSPVGRPHFSSYVTGPQESLKPRYTRRRRRRRGISATHFFARFPSYLSPFLPFPLSNDSSAAAGGERKALRFLWIFFV